MTRAVWPAPAKLNLFLHVIGRRPDGYHLLQTVFQLLDYGDELHLTVTADGAIRRVGTHADIPEDADLAVRAARLLQASAHVDRGATIRVDKRIPIGGGLGGGSSDAATTLLALNRLWEVGLSTRELAELGLRLGADVPVFVCGQTAWAEGVGEALTPLSVAESWYVVLTPPVAVPTARIFAALELTHCSPPIRIRDFHAGLGRNDLEPIVRRLYPEVDQALVWLGQHGPARMTGSGSSVFLPVPARAEGERILRAARGQYRGFVARGANLHPLYNC